MLYKKVGLHLTNLIGFLAVIIGHYIMYLSYNLYCDIISIALTGGGIGIIYYPSTTNACEWFMEHNGLIIGIIETMISFGSVCFCYIGEIIINKEKIQSHYDDNLYDYEMGMKMKDYLLFLIILAISIYLISIILILEKKVKITNSEKNENLSSSIELEDKTDKIELNVNKENIKEY